MKDLTKNEKRLLRIVHLAICPSCGVVGEVKLTDTVTYTREWLIHKDGIGKPDSEQSDTTPYEFRCARCNARLRMPDDVLISEEDFDALIDIKDAAVENGL